MDEHFHISDAKAIAAESEAMGLAEKVLGGRKVWRGQVRGLMGLLHRGFTIQSTGKIDANGLVFDERLSFDDGEVQTRAWRISEGTVGLTLDADGVALLEPGFIKKDALVFVYRLKFGALNFRYRDVFKLRTDGGVENEGFAFWRGVPLMKITATSQAA